MKPYRIPAHETRIEHSVMRSRFICTITRADSVEQARAFIERIKHEFAEATTHAYAFCVGHGANTTLGSNDGGEPKGTAGKPMLAILQGSDIGDIVAVVTRYFGGTKLGTGGLVHAFGESVKLALAMLPTELKVERREVTFAISYSLYERVKKLIEAHHGDLIESQFTDQVSISAVFVVEDATAFAHALKELSGGTIVV